MWKRAALIGGGVVAAIGMIGCASPKEDAQQTRSVKESSTTSTAEPTTTTTAAEPTTTTTAKPAATGVACGAPDQAPGFQTPARSGSVPDVVCMDLQLAQDKAQAAGYLNLGSEDASGQDRIQILDRNWVVISQTPAAGTKAAPGTRLVFHVLAYGDPDAPATPDRSRPGPMPKLTCFDLQEAQDTLQSAGFINLGSEDASGQGRSQLIDSNWIVTGQTPAPGGTVDKSARVVLRSVKDGEPSSCP